MSQKKRSFVRGATILAVTSMLVKVIGILYKIPLYNMIGTEGTGLYMMAYPYYTFLLMLSTAGLPPTISKLVAARLTQGDRAGAKKVFRTALVLMFFLGLIFTAGMMLLSNHLATNVVGQPLARLPILCLAPAIVVVSVISAIRGYFQGMQDMVPTAVSQLAEQIGKVIFGLYLAYLFMPRGIEYAAAGATLGIVVSEVIGLLVIIGFYIKKAPRVKVNNKSTESSIDILKQIGQLAIPILIGASIMPLVNMIDTTIVVNQLVKIGYDLKHATRLFGQATGYANTLLNVPGAISLAFCVSIVPAVSATIARGDKKGLERNISMGYKLSMLVGIPSGIGLFVLAEPIMNLLYGYRLKPHELATSGNLLQFIALGVIFLSILQTFNGVLQGMGKVYVPVVALGTGAITKIILCYVLVGTPSINIYGTPISTFACYAVAAIIDIVMIKRLTGIKLETNAFTLRLILASGLMGVAAWATHSLFRGLTGSKIAT